MANLIRNGSMIDGIDGWFRSHPTAVTAHSAADPHTVGGGSLVLSASEAAGSGYVQYRHEGGLIPLGAEETVDFVAWLDGEAGQYVWCFIEFFAHPYGGSSISGTFFDDTLAGGWESFGQAGIAVPEGAAYALIELAADGLAPDLFCRVGDVYFGEAGGAAPLYPLVANVLPDERFVGGGFETAETVAAWEPVVGGETFAHETAAPLAGTGSAKLMTGATDFEGGRFRLAAFAIVLPNERRQLSFRIAGDGPLEVLPAWVNQDAGAAVWSGTLSASPVDVAVTLVAGPAAVGVRPIFRRPGQHIGDIFVDDLSLAAAPDDDAPPASCAPGLSLAVGIGV